MRTTRRTGEVSLRCLTTLLFALLLGACTEPVPSVLPLPTATEAAVPVPRAGQSSYFTAQTIEALVENSPLIVSGEFRSIREVINMARDGNDITKTDLNILGVGQVYEFAVTEYLKGDGPSTIFVVQVEGLLTGDKVGLNLTEENIQKARDQYEYMPA